MPNFKQIDENSILNEYVEYRGWNADDMCILLYEGDTAEMFLNPTRFSFEQVIRKMEVDMLEFAEWYADKNNLPDSEHEVSLRFNTYILPQLDSSDRSLVRQAFSTYLDDLERSGEIHSEQAQHYNYKEFAQPY